MSRVSPAEGKKASQMSADEILDHYMDTTSYYRQTMLSGAVALSSVWRKQAYATGPYETKERLKGFWTNLGLVSALLIGVTYTSAVNPVTSDDPDMETAISVATVFMGISLVFSLAVIIIVIIYLIEVDNATTERDLSDFIRANAPFVDLLTGVFSASVVCLFVSALATMYITYGDTEFMIVVCVSGSITCICAVFAAIVAGHNRFRLWIRYESPEGKAMVERNRERAGREYVAELAALKEELSVQLHELRQLKELQELKEVKDRAAAGGAGSP